MSAPVSLANDRPVFLVSDVARSNRLDVKVENLAPQA